MDHQCLVAAQRHFAAVTPDRIAIRFEGRTTSWREWDRLSSQVANALAAVGAGTHSRVVYLGKNSDRILHLLFGCAKIGAILTPINWRLSLPEICTIVQDAGSEILVVGRDFLTAVDPIRHKCPALRLCLSSEAAAAGIASLHDWLAPHGHEDPRRPIEKDDVVLQLYTSGTTGQPKGVQLTHRNLLFSTGLSRTERLGNWRGDDVCVLPMPFFHAAGIAFGLCASMAGGTLIVVREAQPALIIQAFRDSPDPVTRMGLVPAVFRPLIEHPDFSTLKLSDLRSLTYGGSPVAPSLLRHGMMAFGPVLTQLFGMTETATVGTALGPSDHHHPDRLLSCGRPLPGVDVRVVRADGMSAAVGESGQIAISCDAVMTGYWNRPLDTSAALRDGVFYTGDVGYFDQDGYLYLQDRLQDMIISGGENIYPAEVESVLMEHDAVADVAVFGIPDEKWGEAVKAAVVLKEGATAAADALLLFVRDRIGGHRCPKSIDFVTALPRNSTGKILKRSLREPYWQDLGRRVS